MTTKIIIQKVKLKCGKIVGSQIFLGRGGEVEGGGALDWMDLAM